MRVWVIRGGDGNRLVDDFVTSGSVGLVYPEVPNVRTVDRWDIERRIEATGASNVDVHADVLLAFVHEIVSGDAALLPDPARGEVVVGTFDGPYEHRPDVADERGQHRRRVTWVGRHATKDLPEPLRDVGRQRPMLKRRDSTSFAEHLDAVRAGRIGRPAVDFERPRAPRTSSGGAPRQRSSSGPRAAAPARPAKAQPAVRTCPSCFQQKPAALFEDDICRDCA